MDTLRKPPVASVANLTENLVVRIENIAAASVEVREDNTAGVKQQSVDRNVCKHCNSVPCWMVGKQVAHSYDAGLFDNDEK